MIRYNIDTNEKLRIEQIASRPTIYLDNWAFNEFSRDSKLKNRFTDLLNKSGGTLYVSSIGLREIVKRSDQKQISDIFNFVDLVDGAFINVDPREVIEEEKRLRKGNNPIAQNSPCADLQLLKEYDRTHDPLKPHKVSEVILKLQEELQNGGHFSQRDFEEEVFPIIERARNNKTALSRAKKRFENRNKKTTTASFPHTEELYTLCIDFIAINKTMKMGNKEWRDILHVIVPVAYSDFVLIDSRWTNFIQSTGLKHPGIARVYNRKELGNFFGDLEVFLESKGS